MSSASLLSNSPNLEGKTPEETPLKTFKSTPVGSPSSGSDDTPRRRQESANRGWVSNCCNCIYEVIAAPLVKSSNREIDYMKLLRGGSGGWFLIAVILAYYLFIGLKLALFTAVSSVPGEFFFLNCGSNSVDGNEISSVSKHQLHAFTENDVNIFVQVLHSIIRNEGCRNGLKEKYNIATDYQAHRPIIKDEVIFNDLVHKYDFEPQDAQQLIEMVRILFSKSSHGVVRTYGESGFIYLNDSLLEYCGYHKEYFKEILIFITAIFLMHAVFVVVRVVIRKSPLMCDFSFSCLDVTKHFPCWNPRPINV